MSDTSKVESADALKPTKIWDKPVRLFHWALVLSFAFAFFSGENMSFDNITWHKRAGYLIGALVAFRLIWGFVGSRPARFADFFPRPKPTIKYIRSMFVRKPSGTAGHNPVGGSSVLIILGLLAAQVTTGLFAYSDSFFDGGPLSQYASEGTQLLASSVHQIVGKVLMAFVVIHIAAIIFYFFWKRENLVKPMFTGWKLVRKDD